MGEDGKFTSLPEITQISYLYIGLEREKVYTTLFPQISPGALMLSDSVNISKGESPYIPRIYTPLNLRRVWGMSDNRFAGAN
jgi:hypothetical protein